MCADTVYAPCTAKWTANDAAKGSRAAAESRGAIGALRGPLLRSVPNKPAGLQRSSRHVHQPLNASQARTSCYCINVFSIIEGCAKKNAHVMGNEAKGHNSHKIDYGISSTMYDNCRAQLTLCPASSPSIRHPGHGYEALHPRLLACSMHWTVPCTSQYLRWRGGRGDGPWQAAHIDHAGRRSVL